MPFQIFIIMNQTPDNTESDNDRSADLWSFAVRCYAVEQASLLSLQQNAHLHINDALAAAYAVTNQLAFNVSCWQAVRAGRPRQVLHRVRRYRLAMERSDPKRARLLDWELTLERWDLSLLARCLGSEPSDQADHSRIATQMSEHCDLSVEAVETLLGRLQISGRKV